MKRLFIAIDLAIPVVEQLALVQEEMQSQWAGMPAHSAVRWVEAANIHLTLKFLGDTDAALLPVLREALCGLSRPLFPFDLHCQGMGCFPALERPRIVWAGFDRRSQELLGLLQQALERDLGQIGLASDPRPFMPHITLGRVRSPKPLNLGPLVGRHEQQSFGHCTIRDLALFESILLPKGPEYRVLERFALGHG